MLFLVLVAGCGGSGGCGDGGSQEEQEQHAFEEQSTPVVGEFVGEVPDTNAFFALLAEEPEGEASQEDGRNIRAYLCDGKQLSEWFVGTANANEVSLTSEQNGLQLLADLYSDNATGTITF